MKKQTLKAHYLVPTTEAVEITPSAIIMTSGELNTITLSALPSLGETEMGTIVWE